LPSELQSLTKLQPSPGAIMQLTQANYYLVIRRLENTTSRGTVVQGYKTKEQADQDKK